MKILHTQKIQVGYRCSPINIVWKFSQLLQRIARVRLLRLHTNTTSDNNFSVFQSAQAVCMCVSASTRKKQEVECNLLWPRHSRRAVTKFGTRVRAPSSQHWENTTATREGRRSVVRFSLWISSRCFTATLPKKERSQRKSKRARVRSAAAYMLLALMEKVSALFEIS